MDALWITFLILSSILLHYMALANVSRLKFPLFPMFLIAIITLVSTSSLYLFMPQLEFLANAIIVSGMAILMFIKIRNKVLSLFYSMLAAIVVIMSGTITSTAFLIITGVIPEELRNDVFLQLFTIAVSAVVIFVFSKFTGKFIHTRLRLLPKSLQDQFGKYMIFGLIITLGLYYTNVFLHRVIDNRAIVETVNASLLIVHFFFIVSAVYAFVSLTQNRLEVKHRQEMLDSLKNYTQNIEKLYTEMRKIRHDYVNMITPLHEYIETADLDSVRTYFNDNILPLNKIIQASDNSIDRLKNIGIPELKRGIGVGGGLGLRFSSGELECLVGAF